MSEFMVCLDVEVREVDLDLFDSILARVFDRKPKTGKVYLRPENRQSYLRGGEVIALKRIASQRIGSEANLISIDGLFATGINIALTIPEKKLKEFREEGGFAILALFRLEQ